MSKNDKNPTAGIGDPYWYEWTIGQDYVVSMLNPDNHIESVTLQATQAQGLDDVVVTYTNGNAEYIQVKHTRKEDTLTFGNILSLLPSMSKAWANQKSKWNKCTPILLSNRKIGTTSTTINIKKDKSDNLKNESYERPALNEFLKHFQIEVEGAKKLSDIKMPKDWGCAWKEWCKGLEVLSNDREKLEFLKLLTIKGNHPGLKELTTQVTKKIAATFGVSTEKATSLFSQLDHALREWGTTNRGKKELINREDVYEVLSMSSKNLIGEHMLRPPEPFFLSRKLLLEDLSTDLRTGTNPVIFLSGLPGQGKTSVVSSLANQRDPVIDLRYHAFKPITPQTERFSSDAGITTKAEVLWGDLLTEIRSFFFKGRLAKFNIPVRNDFLTLEELISQVLRLANVLGEERGRPTVIAIDGIDHAARAGVDQYSFLDTLIPPDEVPEHVKFLIVGQPAESYEKYPSWLKEQRAPGVSHWKVEGIQQEDIAQLVATEISPMHVDDFEATVRLISDVSQGNTLATIFAIEEAKGVTSIEELQEILEKRRLTDGVSIYYNKIWSAAVAKLEEKYPFIGQRLACIFSLTKERIKGEDLSKIFTEVLGVSSSDWTESLRSLRPLVVEETNGFRLTYNDIRVHLTKQVHGQPERLREVASLMADFYWKDFSKAEARHASLFELLRKSNRHTDQARAFTPEYVMEGYALGRPIYELQEQCKHALINVADTKEWDCVHIVSCATTTLVQLYKSVDWMGNRLEYIPDVPPLLFSEGRVPIKESWTLDIIYDTLNDAYRLIESQEKKRAHGLMMRWFYGITPTNLAIILGNVIFDEIDNERGLNEKFKRTVTKWGKISQHIGLFWPNEEKHYQSKDKIEQEIWSLFSNGMMEEAIKIGGAKQWIYSRQSSVFSSISKLEENLMSLAYEKKWIEVTYTLKEWGTYRDRLPTTFQIKAASLSLLTGRKDLFNIWVQPIVEEGFQCLNNIDTISNSEEDALLYCMISFVLGWTKPFLDNSNIGAQGTEVYFKQRKDERKRGHLSALLRGSALAGKWLGTYLRRGTKSAEQIVTISEIKQTLAVLLQKRRSYNESVYYHDLPTKLIIEILIECSTLIGGKADYTIYDFINNYCRSYPVNYMMEIGWRYLWNRGDEELLENWFLHWCGPKGRVWHEEIAFRSEIVNRLSTLADEIGFYEEATEARHLLKWGMIGYTGHKEYVLENTKEWYKELSKINPGIWREEGKLLLEICQEATRLGDNRSNIFVESIIASSIAREGPQAMWSLLNAQKVRDPLIDNVKMIFNGLIAALESMDASKQDLLSIWAFGIGALNWQDGSERCYLQDLKNAILYAAKINGIKSIEEDMENLGPAEYNAQGDRSRYRIPERWYEEAEGGVLDSNQGTEEFYHLIKDLSIEEAINTLVEPDNSKFIWKGVYVIANRLKEEKPVGYPKYLQKLVHILITYNHTPYSWNGSGDLYLAYQSLLPLLRDNVRFKLLKGVIANLDFEGNKRIWLDSAAENLDDFCRFRATSVGVKDLTDGLHRHLSLHEMWIRGNGFLPDMTRIQLPTIQPDDIVPETWSEYAVQYFFRVLNSDNLTRIQVAIRGIWSIAQVSPMDLEYISKRWDYLSHSVKERILLIVERMASSLPSVYELFSEIVQKCYKGVDLSLKLQALMILRGLERRTGENYPRWELPIHPEYESFMALSPGDKGVLDIPNIKRGLSYELHGIGMVHSLLGKIDIVVDDYIEDIERKFASYSNTSKPDIIDPEPIPIHSGQIKVNILPQKENLLKIIYHELYQGRWNNVPIIKLAQVLLKSDEPFILTKSPYPAVDVNEWPVDYELDSIPKEKDKILKRISPHLYAGLSEDEVLIGAVLHTYSHSTDVEVVFNTIVHDKESNLGLIHEKGTMNGRTFALYDEERFDPQSIGTQSLGMTYKAGGIGEFNNQSMVCYPALLWQEMFEWYPSKNNPFIWCKDNNPVLKFEYFHGQMRDIAQDYLYRQPFLQRWVCSKKALKELENSLDIKISPVTYVNINSIPR